MLNQIMELNSNQKIVMDNISIQLKMVRIQNNVQMTVVR